MEPGVISSEFGRVGACLLGGDLLTGVCLLVMVIISRYRSPSDLLPLLFPRVRLEINDTFLGACGEILWSNGSFHFWFFFTSFTSVSVLILTEMSETAVTGDASGALVFVERRTAAVHENDVNAYNDTGAMPLATLQKDAKRCLGGIQCGARRSSPPKRAFNDGPHFSPPFACPIEKLCSVRLVQAQPSRLLKSRGARSSGVTTCRQHRPAAHAPKVIFADVFQLRGHTQQL
jgi:hypothetical protein